MRRVRIISLGGISQVTRNMYVYEYRIGGRVEDILLVDCGIGFPDEAMYGVDYLIPDINYLKDKQRIIRGMVLTHGHMDHIGALKFILPQLKDIKIYATRLTAALAEADIREYGIKNKIQVVDASSHINVGSFRISFAHVTHSIPDAANLIIKTPIGSFYHGSDYKFDWTPVDGRPTQVDKIVSGAGESGYLCLLSDCVRSEREGYTLSERIIGKSLGFEIKNSPGKFLFATFSSNISRIQQAVNVSLDNGRRICFSGRSIRKNVEIAKRLKYLNFPKKSLIREPRINEIPANKLSVLLTGSQGEPGSALSRIANGEHRYISINKGDTIVLSADPIPGNESAVNGIINSLAAQGARVVYSDIHDELHVSGHGAKSDLALMLGLARSKYILPIGAEYKQMVQYKELAVDMGYKEQNIILPNGKTPSFNEDGSVSFDPEVKLKNVMIDGLGIGDVGSVVLRDRNQLAEHGFVVIIIPYDKSQGTVSGKIEIVSRGFVFRGKREGEDLINQAKRKIRADMSRPGGKRVFDRKYIRKKVIDRLESFFYLKLNRSPLIVPVIVEV